MRTRGLGQVTARWGCGLGGGTGNRPRGPGTGRGRHLGRPRRQGRGPERRRRARGRPGRRREAGGGGCSHSTRGPEGQEALCSRAASREGEGDGPVLSLPPKRAAGECGTAEGPLFSATERSLGRAGPRAAAARFPGRGGWCSPGGEPWPCGENEADDVCPAADQRTHTGRLAGGGPARLLDAVLREAEAKPSREGEELSRPFALRTAELRDGDSSHGGERLADR